MKVIMLQDVENVGMAGQVINVADGYAANFLIPRKLAAKGTAGEIAHAQTQVKKTAVDKKVLQSKASMIAERIKNLHLTIKERAHNEGRLYGAVGPDEIVELLKKEGIAINRKQVEFAKAVRSIGEHNVTIKLSSKLKPAFTLKVVASKEE